MPGRLPHARHDHDKGHTIQFVDCLPAEFMCGFTTNLRLLRLEARPHEVLRMFSHASSTWTSWFVVVFQSSLLTPLRRCSGAVVA